LTQSVFHNVSFLGAPGRVMSPRPATEALVDRALELIRGRPARVVDVGTGSGAIAVTLALLAPEAEIWATDVSPSAVELARANARRHGVHERVRILEGDLLGPIEGAFDLVAANLPYLPDRLRGSPLYRDLGVEPSEAVFAPGDGLGPYRRLLAAGRERLAPDGVLVLQFRGALWEAGAPALEELGTELARLAA
jgi:release factor glutamine methyltransferase